MNERITPYNITELKENEIFVFGSNSCGVHNGNAASTAMKFGAIMGQAAGAQRQTYAIPSRDMENFKKYIDDFLPFCYAAFSQSDCLTGRYYYRRIRNNNGKLRGISV